MNSTDNTPAYMQSLDLNTCRRAACSLPRRNLLPRHLSDEQIRCGKRIFLDIANKICPGFALEEQQKSLVQQIFRWCMLLEGPLDLNRGLWLWGTIGSGKSTLMRIVREFCYQVRPGENVGDNRCALPFWMTILSANEICTQYAEDGLSAIDSVNKNARLCIDDLGTEEVRTCHYGTWRNVIADLLMRRYDRRLMYETFATSNLSPQDIRTRYEERVYDRCGEMFNFIHYPGYTHRPEIPE